EVGIDCHVAVIAIEQELDVNPLARVQEFRGNQDGWRFLGTIPHEFCKRLVWIKRVWIRGINDSGIPRVARRMTDLDRSNLGEIVFRDRFLPPCSVCAQSPPMALLSVHRSKLF